MTTPHVIRVADSLGPVPKGRTQASAVRESVLRATEDGIVVLDFGDVRNVSPSVADELFGKLARLADEGRVRVENLEPHVASVARFVTSSQNRRPSVA